MVAYSDFIYLGLIATGLQIGALVYLAKISRTIGKQSTIDYAWTNSLMLIYNMILDYLLITVTNRPGIQTIEAWGVFLAGIFPFGMSIGNIRKMRRLYKALTPNSTGKHRFWRWWI